MKRKRDLVRRADLRIRRYCRKLTGKQRKQIVLTAFTLFALGCLYVIFSSLLDFGHSDKGLEIEHIRSPDGLLEEKTKEKDKDNHFKDIQDYGHTENQDTPRPVT